MSDYDFGYGMTLSDTDLLIAQAGQISKLKAELTLHKKLCNEAAFEMTRLKQERNLLQAELTEHDVTIRGLRTLLKEMPDIEKLESENAALKEALTKAQLDIMKLSGKLVRYEAGE